MGIAGLSAGMTLGEYIVCDPLSHPFIEDEVLPQETVFQSFFPDLTDIVDDASLEVEDLCEAVMEHPGAGFFAADATGAIHDDGSIFSVT